MHLLKISIYLFLKRQKSFFNEVKGMKGPLRLKLKRWFQSIIDNPGEYNLNLESEVSFYAIWKDRKQARKDAEHNLNERLNSLQIKLL